MIPFSHRDVNTYNSEGRIIQVEYAMKATDLGTTTIGAKLSDCVLVVSEKKLTSCLQKSDSIKKHFKISDRVVAGISGISSDAYQVISKCRDETMQHLRMHDEEIPIERLLKYICRLALKFGESEDADKIYDRPFGLSFLVAAYDTEPRLYKIDPSGSYMPYKAHSIGSAREAVETLLENGYNQSADREEALRFLIGILKGAMKEEVTKHNVEVSIVDKSGLVSFTPDQISEFL